MEKQDSKKSWKKEGKIDEKWRFPWQKSESTSWNDRLENCENPGKFIQIDKQNSHPFSSKNVIFTDSKYRIGWHKSI